MTRSETDYLKDHIDAKFEEAKVRHKSLQENFESLKSDIPRIAREEAESTIAKTAFFKPAEKWTIGIALFMVLITAFASYGKLSSIVDRFERLEQKIEKERVLENSNWINENKQELNKKLSVFDEKIQKLHLKIRLIENKDNLFKRP